jgi:serine/threonine-protein kinase
VSDDIPTAAGEFAAGSRVAGYLLEERIGRGGMAVVFRALDERLDRTVALKILAPELAADSVFRRRFIGESRAAAAVDDPHIIPVYEAGEASGVLFIAMRFVRGGDVRTLVREGGPLPPGRAVEIISQVAAALDAAHAAGLVHRDVKPANMLLDARAAAGRPDHVYLADFGLSKTALSVSGLTGTGQFLGTLDYVSPEQIAGLPTDGRADQYALAGSAFELLSGAPPFQHDKGPSVLYAHLSQPPPRLTASAPGLPPGTDAVMARALAKDPAYRFASCREFADALRQALGAQSPRAGQEPVTRPAARPGAAQRPLRPLAGAARPGPAGRGAGPADARSGRDVPAGGGPRRPRWQSPGVAVGLVAALLAVGGGYWLFGTRHGGGHPGPISGSSPRPAAVRQPGCGAHVAAGKTLSVRGGQTVLASDPFAVRVGPDGRFVFASTSAGVAVLRRGPGLALAARSTYRLAGNPKGLAITPDGRFLLVAAGNGMTVMNVAAAESGGRNPVAGTLRAPVSVGYAGAVEIALSPDGRFAFVSLQYHVLRMAVFNLAAAIASGFRRSGFVGFVRLGIQPIGLATSPDGRWLYATSSALTATEGPSQGELTVINLREAETHPSRAIVSSAPAGCGPARVVASADGKVVWVTAKTSSDLLAFSAAKLLSDPKHALIAKVPVGPTPIGEILIDGGRQIVVADTNELGTPAGTQNLAVVDAAAALAGRPALLGLIRTGPAGRLPREFALTPDGSTLLVTLNGSATILAFHVPDLP